MLAHTTPGPKWLALIKITIYSDTSFFLIRLCFVEDLNKIM